MKRILREFNSKDKSEVISNNNLFTISYEIELDTDNPPGGGEPSRGEAEESVDNNDSENYFSYAGNFLDKTFENVNSSINFEDKLEYLSYESNRKNLIFVLVEKYKPLVIVFLGKKLNDPDKNQLKLDFGDEKITDWRGSDDFLKAGLEGKLLTAEDINELAENDQNNLNLIFVDTLKEQIQNFEDENINSSLWKTKREINDIDVSTQVGDKLYNYLISNFDGYYEGEVDYYIDNYDEYGGEYFDEYAYRELLRENLPNWFAEYDDFIDVREDGSVSVEVTPHKYFEGVDNAFTYIDSFFNDYLNQGEFMLTNRTGLHTNIGMQGVDSRSNWDLLKAIVMLNEDFAKDGLPDDRKTTTWTGPLKSKVIKKISEILKKENLDKLKPIELNKIVSTLSVGNKSINDIIKELGNTIGAKNLGFNINYINSRGYLEFRYPGDKVNAETVKNLTLYYCYIVRLCCDPNFKKQEYEKKLYSFLSKIIDQVVGTQSITGLKAIEKVGNKIVKMNNIYYLYDYNDYFWVKGIYKSSKRIIGTTVDKKGFTDKREFSFATFINGLKNKEISLINTQDAERIKKDLFNNEDVKKFKNLKVGNKVLYIGDDQYKNQIATVTQPFDNTDNTVRVEFEDEYEKWVGIQDVKIQK